MRSLEKLKSARLLAIALVSAGLFVALFGAVGSTSWSGAGPEVQAVQSYLNRTFLTSHTTKSFDSSRGDLLVACASSHNGVTMTPSDSFNNVWTSAAGPTSTSNEFDLRTQVWYAKNPTVGPGDTFTVHLSTPQALVISVLVVKGADRSAPIDAVSTISDDKGLRSRRVMSPNITTKFRNDLLIGFSKSSRPQIWFAGLGYSHLTAASSNYLVAETGPAESLGMYHSTFYVRWAANWQAVLLAVRPTLRE